MIRWISSRDEPMRASAASHALSASSKLPHVDFRGKIAGIVPGHNPGLAGTVRFAHLGVGHDHIGSDGGSKHIRIGVDEHAIVEILGGSRHHGLVCVPDDVRCAARHAECSESVHI